MSPLVYAGLGLFGLLVLTKKKPGVVLPPSKGGSSGGSSGGGAALPIGRSYMILEGDTPDTVGARAGDSLDKLATLNPDIQISPVNGETKPYFTDPSGRFMIATGRARDGYLVYENSGTFYTFNTGTYGVPRVSPDAGSGVVFRSGGSTYFADPWYTGKLIKV